MVRFREDRACDARSRASRLAHYMGGDPQGATPQRIDAAVAWHLRVSSVTFYPTCRVTPQWNVSSPAARGEARFRSQSFLIGEENESMRWGTA
jgi:hypothetical protein